MIVEDIKNAANGASGAIERLLMMEGSTIDYLVDGQGHGEEEAANMLDCIKRARGFLLQIGKVD